MFVSAASTLFRKSQYFLAITAISTNSVFATAPPGWWTETGFAVEVPNSATAHQNNHSVANIGQAKWMAKCALHALRRNLPGVADQIEADLVGVGKPIASWDPPVSEADRNGQHAPLLVGQLKAISAPFYQHLHDSARVWLSGQRVAYGMPETGTYYPWTDITTDDSNLAPAAIGQLKAVFSLDFDLDQDADGMPDIWEIYWFGDTTTANATTDSDGDGVTDVVEFSLRCDPTGGIVDSDNDGLPDDWEMAWFGNLDQGPNDDPDGDGVSNLQEYIAHTNPTVNADTDADGMPDDWERVYFGNLAQGPDDDADNDHVTNLQEYLDHTDPTSAADLDLDGLPDDWEIYWFNDLSQNGTDFSLGTGLTNYEEWRLVIDDSFIYALLPGDWRERYFGDDWSQRPEDDPDGDGVPNIVEYLNGTDPTSAADTDGDGLPDDWEIRWFGNLDHDGNEDADGDGVSNLDEYLQGTCPVSMADSDSDGLPDDWEMHWFGNLDQGPTDDPDGDGVDNMTEFLAGTDPTTDDSLTDSDHDGLPDAWEMAHFGSLAEDGTTMHFGVSNLEKYRWGLDPGLADTDGDGISDADEIANGTDPTKADTDLDGAKDGTEISAGTDVHLKDHPAVELNIRITDH